MENTAKYERARKRVTKLKEFYIHLTVYVAVNIMLFVMCMLSDPKETWFIFPLLGWGVAVAIHGAVVFLGGKGGSTWEDKKIQEYMDKDNRG